MFLSAPALLKIFARHDIYCSCKRYKFILKIFRNKKKTGTFIANITVEPKIRKAVEKRDRDLYLVRGIYSLMRDETDVSSG